MLPAPTERGAGRPSAADVPEEGSLPHAGQAEIRAGAQLDPGLLLKALKGGSCRTGRASSSGGPRAAAVPTTPAGPGSGRSQSLFHLLGHGSASQLTSSLAPLQHGRAALPGAPGCSGCLGCHARTAFHHVSLERRRRGAQLRGSRTKATKPESQPWREPRWALRVLALGPLVLPKGGSFPAMPRQNPGPWPLHSSQSRAPLPQGHVVEGGVLTTLLQLCLPLPPR